MSDAVTKLLDEADAMAAKATKGPWVAIRSHSYCSPHVRSASLESAVLYGRSWTSARDGSEDVEFAANARDLVPKLSAMVSEMRAALGEIKRDHGKVCADFELCKHESCASSYAAWAISDSALRRVEAIAKGEET